MESFEYRPRFMTEEERMLEQRVERFNAMRRQRPDLAGFMTGDPGNAARLLRRVQQLLAQNPQLLEELNSVSATNEDQITMLIIPGLPLVISKSDGQTSVLAPTLSCTLNAISDLFRDQPRVHGQYDIVVSDNGLEQTAWEMASKTIRAVLSYDRKSMKPEDYVALASQGVFNNELFRIPLPK